MKGRGIDFEHRFNTSRWAEDLVIQSLNKSPEFIACHYGLSEVVMGAALKYGDVDFKEPDIIVFKRTDLTKEEIKFLSDTIDLSKIDRVKFHTGALLAFVHKKACLAIEIEFSPYRASEMNGRNWIPRTAAAWDKRPLKHAKPPTAPNIWVKDEDLDKLVKWQANASVPIIIVHLFDQEAFSVSLDTIKSFDTAVTAADDVGARKLQVTRGIFKFAQQYDRIDAQGARETKTVFITTPNVACKVGDVSGVVVEAQIGLSSSKKYVSHIVFSGGELVLGEPFKNWILHLKK